MELLAPAGGMEQLSAAIRFGADAVYLATDKFGMRARACNFPIDTLPEAVSIAHNARAKVHVTCNILMSQDDIALLPAFFEAVQDAGVDALILSDLGAFSLAGKYAPHVERHVSTQASVANSESARMWYELGAKRIVCAREMSISDIAKLRADTPKELEIEAFVHGAMCMAVSGRCLISSYLTGRSANRGHCTQPCRWNYQLNVSSTQDPDLDKEVSLNTGYFDETHNSYEAFTGFGSPDISSDSGSNFTLMEEKRPGIYFPIEEDGGFSFIMNAKDLNMLSHIDALRSAGIDSIKIEGRNKKAFYVASVVSAYRRVLDGENPALVEHELYDVSHRPYGTGFYFDEAQQASDYDGYEQECLHIADVIGCWPTNDGYRVLTRCRNRWDEGDELEALIPRKPASTVRVRNLMWHEEKVDAQGGPIKLLDVSSQHAPSTCRDKRSCSATVTEEGVKDTSELEYDHGIALGQDWGKSYGLGEPVPVAVANRSVALYSFETHVPIPAGSYLRKRVFRRSARHE